MVFGLIAAALAGLNAPAMSKRKDPGQRGVAEPVDIQLGKTGTQAYFTLLNETGRMPLRWQNLRRTSYAEE